MRYDRTSQKMVLVRADARRGPRDSGVGDHRRHDRALVVSGRWDPAGVGLCWVNLSQSSNRCFGRAMVLERHKQFILNALYIARWVLCFFAFALVASWLVAILL